MRYFLVEDDASSRLKPSSHARPVFDPPSGAGAIGARCGSAHIAFDYDNQRGPVGRADPRNTSFTGMLPARALREPGRAVFVALSPRMGPPTPRRRDSPPLLARVGARPSGATTFPGPESSPTALARGDHRPVPDESWDPGTMRTRPRSLNGALDHHPCGASAVVRVEARPRKPQRPSPTMPSAVAEIRVSNSSDAQ